MNLDEAEKQLDEQGFAQISADTWIYRTDYMNAYLTINKNVVELLFQNCGTNMVMIGRKDKLPISDLLKAITYCVTLANALSHEVDIFVNHCSKLMDRSLFKPITK